MREAPLDTSGRKLRQGGTVYYSRNLHFFREGCKIYETKMLTTGRESDGSRDGEWRVKKREGKR